MPSAPGRVVPPGWRAFARYAHGPNALGYCGPPARAGEPGLVDVALGEGLDVDVPDLAAGFSGAWPYQQVLAELSGVADPLSPEVVEAYWTGNSLTRSIDREAFARALLERIVPLAGHHWAHLGDDLVGEAAPTHLFHVIGVYPWSRLLHAGAAEPLQVIDSCRIRAARVLAVDDGHLRVVGRHLSYGAGGLSLAEPVVDVISWVVDGRPFADGVSPGSWVAVHWGFACDVLTQRQVAELDHWTRWQLRVSNPRIRAAASSARS